MPEGSLADALVRSQQLLSLAARLALLTVESLDRADLAERRCKGATWRDDLAYAHIALHALRDDTSLKDPSRVVLRTAALVERCQALLATQNQYNAIRAWAGLGAVDLLNCPCLFEASEPAANNDDSGTLSDPPGQRATLLNLPG